MKKMFATFIFNLVCLTALSQCINGDCENGYGTYLFEDKTKAEGKWKNGKMNGSIKIFYSNGNFYEGGILDNNKNGLGIYKTENAELQGNFVQNKLNGKGKIIFYDKTIHEGLFKDNILNGYGKITLADGSSYEGNFVDNKLNGKGIYIFSNGNKFEGEFKENKFYGQGILYYLKGGTLKGAWINDEYISGSANNNPDVIKLELLEGGVYNINVEINNVLKIDMVLDTGASDILLTSEIVLTLIKTRTIDENDILEGGYYLDANGNINYKVRFNLKEIKIGRYTAKNVVCCVNENLDSKNLLGLMALKKIGNLQLDFEKNELSFY